MEEGVPVRAMKESYICIDEQSWFSRIEDCSCSWRPWRPVTLVAGKRRSDLPVGPRNTVT